MAVEFQNKSEVKVASGTSITAPIPIGWAVGDLLIAYITKDDDDTITPPAGWTLIQNAVGGTACRIWVGWRIAEAGDTEWTWTGDSEGYYGVILRYKGHDPTTPIKASDSATDSTQYPIAPSVNFENLNAGSLVLQVFGADDNDIPYTVPSQLTPRFNDSVTTTGGAGGDRTGEWILPTGFNDPGECWDAEAEAYDGEKITRATSVVPASSWGCYLELTCAAISCSKVRFYAYYYATSIDQISLDVYYSGTWHNIYEGIFADREWVEKEIGSIQTVTAMRAKFHNINLTRKAAYCYETAFFQPGVGGTGNTGTANFTMNAIEEWVAVSVIIEAAVEGGLIDGYIMNSVPTEQTEEVFGYFMKLVEEFGYYMNVKGV